MEAKPDAKAKPAAEAKPDAKEKPAAEAKPAAEEKPAADAKATEPKAKVAEAKAQQEEMPDGFDLAQKKQHRKHHHKLSDEQSGSKQPIGFELAEK